MEQPEMVAVLFVDKKSIYKTLPGVDAYDVDRDAHTFPGGMPVVAHPPCRTWGKLAHMSTASDDDHQLAVWAVEQVRIWGGYWSIRHTVNCGHMRGCLVRRMGMMNLGDGLWI